MSLPTRECGLKQNENATMGDIIKVTPHVGVWIETILSYAHILSIKSLPTWECGLKQGRKAMPMRYNQSLPTWECGLKHTKSFVVVDF